MQVAEYRKQIERFEESLNCELYRFFSGQDTSLSLAHIYSDFSDLHSLDAYREIDSEIERTPASYPSRIRSLEKIRGLIIEGYLDARSLALVQEAASLDAQSVHSSEVDAPMMQIPVLLARQPDVARRRELNTVYIRALLQSEKVRRDRIARLHEAARELGFDSYLRACERVTSIDYRVLSGAFDSLLAASEAEYLDDLRTSIEPALGISLEQVHRCDVGYWLSVHEPPNVFGARGLISALDETIGRLGVQPERANSILLDLEARPRKALRAFCLPIRIPSDIRVVMLPTGGYRDFAALFHESGHAHHLAWTSPDLPAEHRIHGDRGLAEAYGFLLEHVTRERLWLLEIQSYPDSSRFLHSRALFDAYNIRRHVAMLKCEVLLYGGADSSDAPQVYAETLTQYTGVRHDPECCWSDLDDGFYSADYLRAWIFEAMLREHFRVRFGYDWFHSREAGKFLKEIWETGQLYTADELSREIGLGTLDPQVLDSRSRPPDGTFPGSR